MLKLKALYTNHSVHIIRLPLPKYYRLMLPCPQFSLNTISMRQRVVYRNTANTHRYYSEVTLSENLRISISVIIENNFKTFCRLARRRSSSRQLPYKTGCKLRFISSSLTKTKTRRSKNAKLFSSTLCVCKIL